MIQVETRLIPADIDIEHYTSHLCRKLPPWPTGSIDYRGASIGCAAYVVGSGAPMLLAESYNPRIDEVKGVGCLFKHVLSVKT